MRNLRDYAVITGTYWVFTLTDGALRMLMLLHLHQLGCAPLEIASLFLFYEFFGIVTNLFGGWIGARHGLKLTLFAGVALQILACLLLAARVESLSIPLFMVAQAMSGTAKDLTKMTSKSYVKLVAPPGDPHGLMRWVAVLTGSKNMLKGIGFFLGGLLLSTVGFSGACLGMAAALGLSLVIASALLPRAAGRSVNKVHLKELISRDSKVNWLSASRLFLFGSRDIWFVLALPIFLSSQLGWTHPQVGAFLATWVIGYGIVQALAPAYVGGKSGVPDRPAPNARKLSHWTAALLLPLAGILAGLLTGAGPLATLAIGLIVFGVIFATGSSMHSYLIVAYADDDRVSLSVGFYYMANAAGRLVGTVLSGALFQAAGEGTNGLLLCIAGSLLFVVVSALLCVPLRRAEAI
ncbi:MAG: MFS family permease [Planctomycetota bacterium]|jgi:MFS family permease